MVRTFKNIWLNEPRTSSEVTIDLIPKLPEKHNEDETFGNVKKLSALVEKESRDLEVFLDAQETQKKICATTLLERPFTKNACLTMVQECVQNLTILIRAYGSQVEDTNVEAFAYKTVYDRYGRVQPDYNSFRIDAQYTNLHKIQKVVKELIDLFQDMYHEIDIFGGASCLVNYIQDYYSMSIEEKQMLVDLEAKKRTFKKLQKDMKFDKNLTDKLKEVFGKTCETTVELKDTQEYVKAQINYIQNWEASRREQNFLILNSKETGYKSTLDEMRYKMELEDLIHRNIETFFNEIKDDHQADIEKWMEVYDKEIDQKDLEILKMKQEIDKVVESREKLHDLYESRTKEMEDYLEYKRLKKIEQLIERTENKAAIKIQTWWREVMFIKKLGPYRRKKKGKKGDKKKKR